MKGQPAQFAFCFILFALAGMNGGQASCALPNQIANGQIADASKIMGNYNALVDCITTGAPAGTTGSVQYNAGNGALGGVGPLTNGQLVIGSTGNAPQAATLAGGNGITITNGPGAITISSASGAGSGLYSQVMSATPQSGWTGLSNWLNQSSATVTDSPVGIAIRAPSSGNNDNISGRFMAAPTPPYRIRALIAATRNSTGYGSVNLGWYDGTNKMILESYTIAGGNSPKLIVNTWNSPTSYNGQVFESAANAFSQPIWLEIADDGNSISAGFSQDGANFITLYTVAKSSSFLGGAGFNNVVFSVNPHGGQAIGTLMSWQVIQ